ncbi:hypothetical protein [Rhodoligotrophos defluvii]|uniref:hypothetical protein n=1 Tax=Rhodoligotrophos defluvii TaxID=2561934 RepID=UPI0010C9EB0D|nr:hypothetical protein [Rhodoligotrophos defluvii]
MPKISHMFFKSAVLFLILGVCMGIVMAMTGDHSPMGAHAHLNLLGWVSSALFGGYYALNPVKAQRKLAVAHFYVFTLGVVVMIPALYFMLMGNTALEPLVAAGSLIVLVGVLLFAAVMFTSEKPEAALPMGTVAR